MRHPVKINIKVILIFITIVIECGYISVCAEEKENRKAETSHRYPILDTLSFWKTRLIWSNELVRMKSGKLVRVGTADSIDIRKGAFETSSCVVSLPSPPSAGWVQPDFDDTDWARFRGPFTGYPVGMCFGCFRGTFKVIDPVRVGKLTLDMTFQGGVVLYLNGKELVRSGMPDGSIFPDTPALEYPVEVFVDSKGKKIKLRDNPELGEKRFRHIGGFEIPQGLIRRGINVLAVELHRSPAPEEMYRASPRAGRYRLRSWWSRFGIDRMRVSAENSEGIVANYGHTGRPSGLQVWNRDIIRKVWVIDYVNPWEKAGPVDIRGTRNGVFSGSVVVGDNRPIKKLKVKVSDLIGPAGSRISADSVKVSYAMPGCSGHERWVWSSPEIGYAVFDELHPDCPEEIPVYREEADLFNHKKSGSRKYKFLRMAGYEEPGPLPFSAAGAVQPVWFSVKVPEDAVPGRYKGSITLSAQNNDPVSVPLDLYVSAWRLPDPADFGLLVDLIQSPESVALKYNVPLWSEEHWKLIDISFRRIAELGGKTIYIPVTAKTHFGNTNSMVRWIQEPDGTWSHDFSLVKKYVDIAVKNLGQKIPVACIYCWDLNMRHLQHRKGPPKEEPGNTAPFITVVDRKTGRMTEKRAPDWEQPEAVDFWKPVFSGIRRILESHDIGGSMMFGIAGDRQPTKATLKTLQKIDPDTGWVCRSHGRYTHMAADKSVKIHYMSTVWGASRVYDPSVHQCYGWKNPRVETVFPRGMHSEHGLTPTSGLVFYRKIAECSLKTRGGGGLRGFGPIGADFWDVLKPGEFEAPKRKWWNVSTLKKISSRKHQFRFPLMARNMELRSQWQKLGLHHSVARMLGAGRSGAVSTVRYEMLREGIQEAEARICVEKCLTDKKNAARLDNKRVEEYRKLLDNRVRAYLLCASDFYHDWRWFAGSGWKKRTQQLYDAAADIASTTSQ